MSAYELRTYGVAPGKIETLATIFRELVVPMLGDYGIESVGYCATAAGDTLHYVVRHDSLDVIESNWTRFHADPRWQPGLDAQEGGDTAVTYIKSVPLVALASLAP